MTTPNNMIYRTWRYSFWQLTLPVSSRDPISSQPFQNLKPYTKLGCPDFGHQIGEICRYFHPFPELLMAAQSDRCRASQQLLDGYTARHLCDSLRVTRQPPVIHERYVERWQTIGEWRANYRSYTRDVSNGGSPSASRWTNMCRQGKQRVSQSFNHVYNVRTGVLLWDICTALGNLSCNCIGGVAAS